jgi:hypothetical protein
MSNSGPYLYTQSIPNEANVATNGGAARVVYVTANTNNPLTLTGSFANSNGFIVISPTSVSMQFSGASGSFGSGQFYVATSPYAIYPLPLTYVSCSGTGAILVLYAQ